MNTRRALVTGGTRGIGKSISLALHDKGMKVVATYTSNDERAKAFAAEYGIDAFRWDVSEYQQCVTGVAKVIGHLGGIDVLVNNAGITRDAMLHKMSFEQWHQVLRTNLDSCFNMCSQVVSNMREQQFGRIINISSINALSGQLGQTNYSAAKAGMIGFTKSMALETAKYGVTVNAVAPGYIDTDMMQTVPEPIMEKIIASIPTKRLGKPEEVGQLVAYLCAENSGFITGATFSINGGQYMA